MLRPEDVTVVLVRPARQANVGGAARAMKVMGFTRLILVDPQTEIGGEARAVAHGSQDVLDEARLIATVGEAVADHVLVAGTTARQGRDRTSPIKLRKFVQEVMPSYLPGRVAMVFGSEAYGLTNEDLDHCQFSVEIPTGPLFHSLNLAQAVMVACYELFTWRGDEAATRGLDPGWGGEEAPRHRRKETLYRGIEAFLRDVGYPTGSSVERAIADTRRILGPTWWTERDVATVLGLFRHVRYLLRQIGKEGEPAGSE